LYLPVIIIGFEELNDPYSSLNIVRVIKSRRMRFVRHVARVERERCVQRFGGKPWGKETAGETQA
jgi:hypothetical protein